MAYKKLKYWFDEELAKMLASKILLVMPSFEEEKFIKSVSNKVADLELKDRVELIADELNHSLAVEYKEGIRILLQIFGPENIEETGMFLNYYWIMPIAKYVEKYGQEDFELSMHAIEEITKRNTGEYTIRPFLESKPKQTLKRMVKWSKSKNKHVRRLASEGVRPRLPWAKKMDMFIKDPKPILGILNQLKDDQSKYVQKSVANCINDILKDNLDIGKELIESWKTAEISKERKWIIKHSLRNLIKAGDKWATGLLN